MGTFHKPKVSVRIPAYNHEKYIRECLESVLNQTFQDFEIIIADDCSTDKTVDIIKEFKDSRIKLHVLPKNQGCASTSTYCARRSCGEYVANISSDDVWEKEKLEKQIAFMETNPQFSAVFTKVQFIDDESNNIKDSSCAFSTIFEVSNRSKEGWLNYFFHTGSCLANPSVLIRKSVYEELNYQDKRLVISDFDLWVRFCMKYELFILDEKLTRLRVRDNAANLSGDRLETHIRNSFELKQILDNYLQIDTVNKLLRVFPECNKYGQVSQDIIPYFLGRLAYDTNRYFQQLWGLETIYHLLKDEERVHKLEENCSFSYPDFHKLCTAADVFGLNTISKFLRDREDLEKSYQKQLQNMHTHLDNYQSSISWRITEPLRIWKIAEPLRITWRFFKKIYTRKLRKK